MPASHAKTRAELAQLDRLAPEELDLDARSRHAWEAFGGERYGAVMKGLQRSGIYHIVNRLRKREERSDPLELTMRLLVIGAAFGVPEANARVVLSALEDVVDACYAGTALRAPTAIDLDEAALDATEDILQTERLVAMAEGRSPSVAQLEEEALVRERIAGVERELARSLRREIRRRQHSRPPARRMEAIY